MRYEYIAESGETYILALLKLNSRNIDERIVAERQWQARKLAPKPQQQCDVGLFSDDHKQTELFK